MKFNPIETAPKNSQILMLLVVPKSDHFHEALQDSSEPTVTIGFNSFEDSQTDHWHILGWNWEQDFLKESQALEPIGWLPFPNGTEHTVGTIEEDQSLAGHASAQFQAYAKSMGADEGSDTWEDLGRDEIYIAGFKTGYRHRVRPMKVSKEKEAEIKKALSEGCVVFSDNWDSIEARQEYELKHSCPHCMGSGHIDDVDPAESLSGFRDRISGQLTHAGTQTARGFLKGVLDKVDWFTKTVRKEQERKESGQ